METVRLEELVEGSSIFESKGISYVKVTQLAKGRDGEAEQTVRRMAIPIKSTGVSELIDEFRRKAPRPPDKKCLVHPDDEVGKDMKITKKQWVYLPDFTDADYLEAREKYESELGLKIVLKGIDLPIKDRAGQLIEDPDKKIDVLKGMGLTGEQFSQLVKDIQLLTKWEEEQTDDFLAQ